LDKNLLFISTDPNSNNSKISSDLWKIFGKKPTKKKPAKKKPAKKKPLKRKPIKKRVSQKRRTTKKASR